MADPLSTLANTEDDDVGTSDALPAASNTTASSSKEDSETPPAVNLGDLSEGEDDILLDTGADTNHKKVSGDGDTQLPSPGSERDESDLLAQIEEEMNSGTKDLVVTVETPEKVVKTMESYVAFTIKTKTTRSDFEDAEYAVKRRYNDFLWLRQQLEDSHPHLIIPPLPEKHSLTIDRFDKEFIRFREVALHRFTSKLALHPTTSKDETFKAFITLDHNDFQTFKKKGSGILSRMTKSISSIGGSIMLKNRGEEYTKLYDYAGGLGERMGACERVTSRLITEQNDYLLTVGTSISMYQHWQTVERRALAENLGHFAELLERCHAAYKSGVDEVTLKTLLPFKEYVLYADVLKSSLAKRDALQHEMELLAEELVKSNDDLQQLESGQTGGGFLGRNTTEEAIQTKKDKLKSRISELESAHSQCKRKLEERNKQLNAEVERWHLTKKMDVKEAVGGLAERNIQCYDQQITALEETLHSLKECLVNN